MLGAHQGAVVSVAIVPTSRHSQLEIFSTRWESLVQKEQCKPPRTGAKGCWGLTKSSQPQRLPAISTGRRDSFPLPGRAAISPAVPRDTQPHSILAARFTACLGQRKLSQQQKGAVGFEDLGCYIHLTW